MYEYFILSIKRILVVLEGVLNKAALFIPSECDKDRKKRAYQILMS